MKQEEAMRPSDQPAGSSLACVSNVWNSPARREMERDTIQNNVDPSFD